MRLLPFVLDFRRVWAIKTLLLVIVTLASLTLNSRADKPYYDVRTGRWVHPDEEPTTSENRLVQRATIRIRLGAVMGRTYGARYRWKVNGWGWDTKWRSNDDEVEEDGRGKHRQEYFGKPDSRNS